MKLHVAVHAYDRRVTVETVRSLLNEQAAAALAGVDMQISFVPGSSLVHIARDQAVRDFLQTDADRLVFVDSDVAWEAGSLLRLADHPVDFVGGAYRYKAEQEGYPVAFLDRPELWADPATGLLEVAAVPGGFLSVSRSVVERLKEAFPRTYTFHDQTFQAFFHCPPGCGEDGTFCEEWKAIGGQVWLDPTLTLTHCEGAQKYTGNIGDWLKSR